MINDLILLQQLMEKYKLPEPVPAAVRDFVLRSRRKTLLNIMRKLDIYSPIFGVIIFVFFFLKKLGFNVTIVKTTIIIGLSSLLLSASISYGIYNIVENNNSGVSKQIKEHDSKIDNKIHDAAGNPDDALLKQIRDLVDAALIWNGDFIIINIRDIYKIK